MIDPSPSPSRQLRIFARIARWSLGVLIAFWLLLALVGGALHGLIVPRIGEWRAEVESLATKALGAPVSIDAITAQSKGLFPTIHLSGVSVRDVQGRDALRLDSVIVTVSARSLLRMGLEQLYIDAPHLDIRHLPDGRWQVAGLDVVESNSTETSALDWLLEQPELVIRQGVVSFTDEQRQLETIHLHDVDVVVRHRHWSHVLRIDATPTIANGAERMQLIGAFRQPLLPSSQAPWTRWTGQWFASIHLNSVPLLPWPSDWAVEHIQGHGMARAWLDIDHGQPIGMTADVALPKVQIDWKNTQAAAFEVQQLKGRIQAVGHQKSWHIQGSDFSFVLSDGTYWPASNWEVSGIARDAQPNRTHIDLDYADLSMVAKVLQSLPAPTQLQDAMSKWNPQGQVREFQMQWSSSIDYLVRGQLTKLVLLPQPAMHGVGLPGVQGLNSTFEFNARGGKASLDMQAGTLQFPGVFEEPSIPFDVLQAQLHWSFDNENIKVEIEQAQFENLDAKGLVHGMWRTGDADVDRLPGYLHIQGILERADGARVHRYLPLAVPETARHYVRDSVHQGSAAGVEFEVKGLLRDMPFDRPDTGRFFIKAPVHDVVYAFAPPSLHRGGEPLWPALTDLSGTLVFEGAGMQVQQAVTSFQGHSDVRMHSVSAQIPDLHHPHVKVHAVGQPDLQAALVLVKHSPLSAFTNYALDHAQAEGSAHVTLDLDLPINHLELTKVHGRIGFAENLLQFNLDTPALQQLHGAVHFHEQGFELHDVHAQSLGGNIAITGGMPSLKQGVRIQAKGVATSEGLLRQAVLPALAQLAQHAQGHAAYTVDVNVSEGAQTLAVRSDLRGMALHLPSPLNKAEDEVWPLSVVHSVSPQQRQDWRVGVKGLGSMQWSKDMGRSPDAIIQGQILVGDDFAPIPLDDGVSAHIHLAQLDIDAWMRVLNAHSGDVKDVPDTHQPHPLMPQRLKLSIGRIFVKERELEGVKADFSRNDGFWHGELEANNFAGYVEYREPAVQQDAGLLFARLSHLYIPKSDTQKLNQLEVSNASEVGRLPALDIEVKNLEVSGRALGKLQLKARNTIAPWGRNWMLDQFYLETSEARWKANGYWGSDAEGVPRLTHMSFLLEIDDSGKLLNRFGLPDVIRDGHGRLSGNIAWQGSPITPNWLSMEGGVQMHVEKGQFLKVEPGMGKLLSVLSLQSLTKRLSLDFRDVFSQGFAFDYIRGDIVVAQGVAHTNNLQMKGLNAAVLMDGSANLMNETQDLKVVVVPEINAMTASLAATAINPVVGLGSFLAQMFLRGPLMEAATRTFHVHGKWEDPLVESVRRQAASDVMPSNPKGEIP